MTSHLSAGVVGWSLNVPATHTSYSVSQGRICLENVTCCHTEIEVADQTFYFIQLQYTETGSTSPSADLISPGAWQDRHCSARFEVTGMTRPGKIPTEKAGIEPGSAALKADTVITMPTRRYTACRRQRWLVRTSHHC